ncbi:hypothetical protein QEV83_00425 [Methylocapsa sp. D3K7]|uniref:hypothetical protein n=1 Tax=Methylocapsa sp. D3K7 TaxID=3041435 RepID=UPI00244E5C2A|nr:hypothetical protein [Methylocapsa sp. D3K7]WGJ14825.1 hypothetical protein QEV83_00425 [Methylocapsa sp. D3K7]
MPSTVHGCWTYAAGKAVVQSGQLKREHGLFNFILLLSWLMVAPHVILLACLRRNNEIKT